MSAILSLRFVQPDYEAMDDMARFGSSVSEKDLDASIEAKKRTFNVGIRRGKQVVAVEHNVRALTSCDVVTQMQDLYGLNYGFRVVAQ